MSKKKKQYTGCIGSIEKARDFARESFVYGLKDKSEYTEISARKYDEATRQMRDWFQDCLQTRTVKIRNKVKYLSLNCRDFSDNPLYKIWKTCTFTTNEIIFFFFLLDYLSEKDSPVTLAKLHTEYYKMHRTDGFQPSAAQKWMKNKGCPSGIFIKDDKNRYRLAPEIDLSEIKDLLYFYSQIAPGGVIGSFISDKEGLLHSPFRFKQHYTGQAFDCEVICNILLAIKYNRSINISYIPSGKEEIEVNIFPVKVYSSTQNGRQFMFAWSYELEQFCIYRIDRIKNISISESENSDAYDVKEKFNDIRNHIWGVSLGDGKLEHIEFVVKVDDNEPYILRRLYREKRCGTITQIEGCPGHYKFEADVFDAHELFPWIRTFICRIMELKISNSELETLFWKTVKDMYNMYSLEDLQS